MHLFLCADKTHCKKTLSFEEEKNNYEWPFPETLGEDGLKEFKMCLNLICQWFFLAGGRGHFWGAENILQSNYLNIRVE